MLNATNWQQPGVRSTLYKTVEATDTVAAINYIPGPNQAIKFIQDGQDISASLTERVSLNIV